MATVRFIQERGISTRVLPCSAWSLQVQAYNGVLAPSALRRNEVMVSGRL